MKIVSHIEDVDHPHIEKIGRIWVSGEHWADAHHIIQTRKGEQRRTLLSIGEKYFQALDIEGLYVSLDLGYNEKYASFNDIEFYETNVSKIRGFLIKEDEIPALTQSLFDLINSDFSHSSLAGFYDEARQGRPEVYEERGKQAPLRRTESIEARMLEAEAIEVEA